MVDVRIEHDPALTIERIEPRGFVMNRRNDGGYRLKGIMGGEPGAYRHLPGVDTHRHRPADLLTHTRYNEWTPISHRQAARCPLVGPRRGESANPDRPAVRLICWC